MMMRNDPAKSMNKKSRICKRFIWAFIYLILVAVISYLSVTMDVLDRDQLGDTYLSIRKFSKMINSGGIFIISRAIYLYREVKAVTSRIDLGYFLMALALSVTINLYFISINYISKIHFKSKKNRKKSLYISKVPNMNLNSKDSAQNSSIDGKLLSGEMSLHSIERLVGANSLAVETRRKVIQHFIGNPEAIEGLPYLNYDYAQIYGSCCENVIGYVPVPVGVVGPCLLDRKKYYIPMATTEGCLLASTSRGCKALTLSGGVTTVILKDEMTRSPVVQFDTILQASQFKKWIEDDKIGLSVAKRAFDSTSRYAKLKRVTVRLAGRLAYVRFHASTGDAMGMNMVTKGCQKAIESCQKYFPHMLLVSISGNVCCDKKPSAINWIEGRGKSLVAEAIVSGDIIENTLKTTVQALADLNSKKTLIGSAIAGSIGGFNAHSANIITAIFIACGQDVAQNVESSSCITVMQSVNSGKDLYISCTLPSLEVGTVGGGTLLPAQSSCLDLMGVKGPSSESPGANAKQFSRIIAAAVMAGELSLGAALVSGDLIQSHLELNRSSNSFETSSDDF